MVALLRVIRRLLSLAFTLGVVVVVVGVGPASAHTGFELSIPADASTVDGPVAEIVLKFSGVANPAGEGFVVFDPAGAIRIPETVESDVDGLEWTLGFEPPLARGIVGVRWTVQAPDAHPISGAFSFTAAAGAPRPTTTLAPTTSDVAETNRALEASTTTASPIDRVGPDDQGQAVASVEEANAGSQPQAELEEFLGQTDTAVPAANGIGTFGRLLAYVGTMLSIGGLAFAATVVGDHRRDLRSVLRTVGYSAVAVVAGTAIDLVSHVAVANGGWAELLAIDGHESVTGSAFGFAIGLRTVAGLVLLAAVGQRLASRSFATERRELILAGDGFSEAESGGDASHRDADYRDDATGTRWSPSLGIVAAVVVLLASFSFDGHTVTEGNRWITGAVDIVHVMAASIWAGGVVAFAVVLWRRHRRGEQLGALEMALRFSVVAGGGLVVAGLAGSVLAIIILDQVAQLWTTTWGQLLMAKTVAVAAAAALGTYNHFVVVPWMNARPMDDSRSTRLRNTATGEAILLLVVIVATAFLVGASSQA